MSPIWSRLPSVAGTHPCNMRKLCYVSGRVAIGQCADESAPLSDHGVRRGHDILQAGTERMNIQRALVRAGCALAVVSALYAFQKPFRVYISMERADNIPLPPDYQEKTEWVFARLMY